MSLTPGGYRFQYPPGFTFSKYLPPASLQIEAGDLLYWTGSVAQPLSSKTLLGSQVLDQAAVKPLFLGVAVSGRITAQSTSVWPIDYVEAASNCLYLADCASATWEVGDLVGVVRNGGATALKISRSSRFPPTTWRSGRCFAGNRAPLRRCFAGSGEKATRSAT